MRSRPIFAVTACISKETLLIETTEAIALAETTLADKKAGDIVIMDVRNVSGITDYFIIATANNQRHIKALGDEVSRVLKKAGVPTYRTSGTPGSEWIVLDYIDFVLHIFSPETRERYAIEQLWKDAPRIGAAVEAEG